MPRAGASIAYRTEAAMPRAGAFMPIARRPPCLELRLPYCLSRRGRRASRRGILNPIARRLPCLALGLSLPIARRLPCLALGLPLPIAQGRHTSHRGFHIAYPTEASVPCRGFQIAYHTESRQGVAYRVEAQRPSSSRWGIHNCLSRGGRRIFFMRKGCNASTFSG